MTKIERWNNVRATFAIELVWHEGRHWTTDDRELPTITSEFGPADELVIEFQSRGYDDPGSMCGGPDRLGWPPEHEDERTLVEAYLLRGRDKIKLPVKVQALLFEFFRADVEAAELPEPGDYCDE